MAEAVRSASSTSDSPEEVTRHAYDEDFKTHAMAIMTRFDFNGDGRIDLLEFTQILKVLDPTTWDDRRISDFFAAVDADKSQKIEVDEFYTWIFGGGSPQTSVRVALQSLGKAEKKAAEWAALRATDEERQSFIADYLEAQVLAQGEVDELSVPLPSGEPGASCNAELEKQRALRRARVVALFEKYDTSSDGCISHSELQDVLIAAGIHVEKASKILADMDLDKDERVDYNEFVMWLYQDKTGAGSFSPAKLRNKLKLEHSAEVCLFLLGDRRVAETNALVAAGVNSAVAGELAMHPQRAEAGQHMVRHVNEWLDPDMRQSLEDEEVLKQLFYDSMPRSAVVIDNVLQVAAPKLTERFLAKIAEEHSSVEVTFHGTAERFVRSIVESGLSVDSTSTRGKLYGVGAYVGTHAGLAHKYTGLGGKKQPRHMFCVLVDTGRVAQGERERRHDRTTVDQLWNPTQYCLVDQDRLLVTHLITYRQVGADYLLESALHNAVSRAAEREERRGKR